MRINTGIICALSMSLAFVVACADSGTDDDMMGDEGSGGQTQNSCGDGTCAASEVGVCTQDCGTGGNGNNGSGAVCGNGQCETTKGESVSTCPSDCNTPGNGSGSNSGSTLDCNDQNTQLGCLTCTLLQQCTPPYDATSCASCGGLGSGFPMP